MKPGKPGRVLAALSLSLLTASARADRLDTWLEKAIGPLVSQAAASGFGTDEDPLLAPWVRRIGSRLAAQSPRGDLTPRFAILASDAANAFALPGGQVFVTRGLLDSVASDDELAGVLAHETGHVARRHAIKQIEENGAAVVLIGFLGGGRGVKLGATLLNVLRGLGRSRALESEADAAGLGIAAAAGYDPRGLVRFLESFAGARESKLEEYVATHPSPEKRLEICWKSPLVSRFDPADRAASAAGYESRGLHAGAAATLAGRDPLALPPLPALALTPERAREKAEIVREAMEGRNGLTRTWKTQRTGATLQQLLLLNSQAGDVRWLVLAARAYGVQARVQDGYARTLRTLQTAPGTWDALAARTDDDAAQGRSEAAASIGLAADARVPLSRAATGAAAVLLALNDRFTRLNSREQWLRYGALEGTLEYAESELSRADDRSGRAWRQLSLARIRRYQGRLTELIPAGDAGRRALWADLLRRRLGIEGDSGNFEDFAAGGEASGERSVRLALAVEAGKSEAALGGARGNLPWADFARKEGVPENVATFLRLLTLDLERETYGGRTDGVAGR